MTPLVFALAGMALAIWMTLAAIRLFNHARQGAPTLFLLAIANLALLAQLFIDRSSDEQGIDAAVGLAQSNTAGRVFTALYLTALSIMALTTVRQKRRRQGRPLAVAAVLLGCAGVLSSLIGTVPVLNWRVVLLPTVLLLVYLAPLPSATSVARVGLAISLGFVEGSLLCALLLPDWAFDGGARPNLFGFSSQRLLGLTPHPNTLGPLCVFAIVLALAVRPRFWKFHVLASVVALVLADSRGAIISLVVAAIVLVYYRSGERIGSGGLATVFLGAAVVASGVATAAITGVSLLPWTSRDLSTINSRTSVWDITITFWRQSPFFGYGPELWSPAFRLSNLGGGFSWAGQAHNQFVQSLGELGIFGFIPLVATVSLLLHYGIRLRFVTCGLSLALPLVMIVNMLTEAPVRSVGVLFLFPLLFTYTWTLALLNNRGVATNELAVSESDRA